MDSPPPNPPDALAPAPYPLLYLLLDPEPNPLLRPQAAFDQLVKFWRAETAAREVIMVNIHLSSHGLPICPVPNIDNRYSPDGLSPITSWSDVQSLSSDEVQTWYDFYGKILKAELVKDTDLGRRKCLLNFLGGCKPEHAKYAKDPDDEDDEDDEEDEDEDEDDDEEEDEDEEDGERGGEEESEEEDDADLGQSDGLEGKKRKRSDASEISGRTCKEARGL